MSTSPLSASRSRTDIRDVFWCYDRLDDRSVQPDEAPSLGAWHMLGWAREHRDRFYTSVLPRALLAQAKASHPGILTASPPHAKPEQLLECFDYPEFDREWLRMSCRHIAVGEKNDRPTESRSAPPPGRFLQLRMRLQIQAWSKSRPMLLTEEDLAAACAAFANLPDDSEPDEAIHWALSQEKLFLHHQVGPDELGVAPVLTADGILSPCHGRAPSKLAVLYLQQALSKGGKFFDMVLRMYKKAMIRGSDAARDDGFGIASDEEMAAFTGR
jgi:hypothetical protein